MHSQAKSPSVNGRPLLEIKAANPKLTSTQSPNCEDAFLNTFLCATREPENGEEIRFSDFDPLPQTSILTSVLCRSAA